MLPASLRQACAWICLALPALAGPALASPAPRCAPAGAQGGVEADREATLPLLLEGLNGYAEWCSNKKLWVERNRALQAILAVDPGNLPAKRGLAWIQVADGVWEPPPQPKPAKNYDPKALKEAPERFAKAIQPWRDAQIELLKRHADGMTSTQRESIFAQILSIDPDDAHVREARGEERSERGWVLAETVRAKARRARIREIVRDAVAATPEASSATPNAADAARGVEWAVCVESAHVRVLSTGDRAEALRMASAVEVARTLFREVFGVSTELPTGFTVHLLCNDASKAAFLQKLAGQDSARASFLAKLEGTGLEGSNSAAWWSPTAERRLDGVVRHVIGAMFQLEFGVSVATPWAWEGFGLYLAREVIGTRLTWYIEPPENNASAAAAKPALDWSKKLLTPGTNWMNEGYRLLHSGDVGGLAATLSRALNKMTPQDLFVSYTLAAYWLEGQAEKTPELLRTIGSKNRPGKAAVAAFEATLAAPLDEFRARMLRWLGERR